MREISMERVNETREQILNTVKDGSLTHEQKVATMARQADSLLEVLQYPEGLKERMDLLQADKIICDLNEGHAPMRPRYIIPDYEKFMKEGSAFLQLDPPKDIWEAVNSLLIFYKHVPSVTNFPVYIGNIDTLLDPFITDEAEAKKAIRLFMTHIDRTILDSFCHANIGPKATVAGRLILEVEKELQNAVPNITVKYDEEITEDSFAKLCIDTTLKTAKPSFANHNMFVKDLSKDYAIASCYNGLKIGGGAYTLVRILLGNAAKKAKSIEDFKSSVLPESLKIMAEYMDERIRFMVEESGFFESNFLAKEGFIHKENFTAMFAMVGMAECVNHLLSLEGVQARFGHSKVADELGLSIVKQIDEFNRSHESKYCYGADGHFLLHAQVGIDLDVNSSPGCRIPIGEEPEEMIEHLAHCALFHPYFPSGVGDIFPVDTTVHKNTDYLLDVIKGSFKNNVRYLSFYEKDSDVIRVTGYLVKKSEMEKLEKGESVLQDTTVLGLGSAKNSHILERKVR